LLAVAILFYGLLTAAGLAWIWIRTGTPIPGSLPGARPFTGLAVGGAGAIAIVGLSALCMRRRGPMRWLAVEFGSLLGPCSPWVCLSLALSSAVGEEVFFRGAMQPALGLWLTSAVFGAVHIGPDRRYLPWTGFALSLGLGLGWLLEWTGSLLGGILAHLALNFLNLLQIMRLASPRARLGPPGTAWHGRCESKDAPRGAGRDDSNGGLT
jgi:membrane protease YdiL (CAAX protease family)